MLRKSLYPYEYMDDWEKFKETLSPEKEDFYSHLNMEDITDADYAHAKRVCKDFEIKRYRRIPRFLSTKWYIIVSWCIWKLSKYVSWNIRTWSCKISFSSWISIASSFMKDYNKNKESPYIQYWDANNLYRWRMSQKLPVNNFEWTKDISQFNEDFIKKL